MNTFCFIVLTLLGIFHIQLSEAQFSETNAEVSIGGLTLGASVALPNLPTIPRLNWNNLPGFNLVHNKIATLNPLNILTGNHQERQQSNLNQQTWLPNSGNQFNQYGPPPNRGPVNNAHYPPENSHQPFMIPPNNNFGFSPPHNRYDRPPPQNSPPNFMPPPFEHGFNGGGHNRPPPRDSPPNFMPPPFGHGSHVGGHDRHPPHNSPPDFMPPPFEHGHHGQRDPSQHQGHHGKHGSFNRHEHMPHYNQFNRNHPNNNPDEFNIPNGYYNKPNEQREPFNPNDEFEYIGTTTESTLKPTNKIDKNNPNSSNLIHKNHNSSFTLCLKFIYPDSDLYIRDKEELSQNYSIGIDPR